MKKLAALLPEKSLLLNIWVLALPVLVSNLLQTSITFVDTLMVGQLGPDAIAAVGMGNNIRFLLLILYLSVSSGTMSLVAQAKGGRDKKRMSAITKQGILSGLMLSFFMGLIGILFSHPVLAFVDQGDNDKVVAMGAEYLELLFWGSPLMVLNLIVNRLMQGAGDTITPLKLTGLMVLLNVGFNYVFIFGWAFVPAYGILGAAIGTLLSRGIVLVLALFIFYSGKNVIHILPGSWKPDWSLIRDILSIGVPSGIQGVFRNGATLLVVFILTATELGTLGAAALAIGFQVEGMATMPVIGLNVAATSLIGQALGKWQIHSATYLGNLMVVMGVLLMCILVLPIVIFSQEIILLFDPSAHPHIVKGVSRYFQINTLALPISAISYVLTGVLRGAGHTTPAMIATLMGRNISTVLFAWLFAIVWEMGSEGVWYGMVIGRLVDTSYMWLSWRAKKWIQVALHKTEIYRKHLKHLTQQALEIYLREIRTPQMAVPYTLEVVRPTDVQYQSPENNYSITFDGKGNYHLPSS